MIKTWPGQTNEEWAEEYRKAYYQTPEERHKEVQLAYEKMLKRQKEEQAETRRIQEANAKNSYVYGDHPSTMENSTATVLYIIIMLVGIIFTDRWLLWIFASIVYFRFITRYERRKREYEKRKVNKKDNK